MTFKKIYGIILGAVVAGLTSCSSELSSEGNATVNPNETARRALTIAVGDGGTRSVVSLETNGNKWENGDLFGAVNMTKPVSLEKLIAKGEGNSTKLEGNIDCANGDKIGVFFPYKQSAGQDQKLVEISMNNGIVSTNGNPAEYKQNGTIENLKYFDYSFGSTNVQVGADGSAKATGSVNMKKQYTILGLKFIATKNSTTTDITEKVKKVTISNVADEAVFKMVTGTLENKSELGTINIETSNLDRIYVAVFPDNNFSPKFTVETNDNKTYTVSVSGKKVEAAAYYPITLQVKEYIPNPPYIEIDGVKWGKYNLQYSTGTKVNGWVDGYHLAENPWDYYTTETIADPLAKTKMTLGAYDPNNVKFDHFRWGDIEYAYNYEYSHKMTYWTTTSDIQGVVSSDKKYGDLAAYASNNKWKLPSATDFNNLMKATAEYIGYFVDDNGNKIYGILFDPNVPNTLKGKVVDKNNNPLGSSNSAIPIRPVEDKLRQFTKSDFENALFFPMAGVYGDYNGYLDKVGSQGGYWTSTSNSNGTQASAFQPQYMTNGAHTEVSPGKTSSAMLAKYFMYSIRPIYVGQ